MDFELVTDSCCNLTEDMIDDFGLHILPLTFMADGEDQGVPELPQRRAHQPAGVLHHDARGQVFRTSLPNLAETEALLRGLLEAGRDVLYVGFSSGLSGTYEATSLLMKDLAQQFPGRKLYAVDTLAASGGQGLLVWHAVQRARAGASIDEVRDWLEENKLHLAHWFTVDDLMFLFRGGRVSKTSAWAGTLLNIKPVMHVDDAGHLVPLEKVRGRRKSLNALVDHMEKSALSPIGEQMVFITHGDCIEDAEYVAAQVKERFGVPEVVINYVDPRDRRPLRPRHHGPVLPRRQAVIGSDGLDGRRNHPTLRSAERPRLAAPRLPHVHTVRIGSLSRQFGAFPRFSLTASSTCETSNRQTIAGWRQQGQRGRLWRVRLA